MAKLTRFGSGYGFWANTANNAVIKLDDILSVLEETRSPKSIKKYLNPFQDPMSLPLTRSNGPFGAMTLVQLDDYPVAACVIKNLFQLHPQAVALSLVSFPPGNFMLHLPAKVDKESEAKKGIIKLMLLHIRGDIDIEATLVSNINQTTPLRGMQVVLNQPCAAQASQFADLVQMTVELTKQQDFTSICSTQKLIWVMSKILAFHMLQVNFATEKVTSLKIEANLMSHLPFFLRGTNVLSNAN
jgi:hypothetical protein